METYMRYVYGLLEQGLVPDFVTRFGIRALLRERLREIDHGSLEANTEAKMQWIEKVRGRDVIADFTEKANQQHYEVSTDFMLSCLGPRAKYSSCLYVSSKETLSQAEDLMLESYCQKANLRDGMEVLDLGCGWGSLSLYLAEKYPKSKIVGLSNSRTQKEHIDKTAKLKGLSNLEIVTGDVNTFDFPTPARFDRILSIEMFEHMKNYEALMRQVSSWLTEDGQFFVHIFCHKTTPYDFEGDGWMASNFFTGGTMPSQDTLAYFQSDLVLMRSWWINGLNYARTCEDWLKLQDSRRDEGIEQLELDAEAKGLSKEEGRKTFYKFRVFYMACAELFAFNGGDEWGVSHMLFRKRETTLSK